MARPVTRIPAVTPVAGPRVREFSAAGAVQARVVFDVRPVYDFVFSLSDDAGATDDLPAEDRQWLTDSKAALRERFGERLDLYGSELCVVLAGLAVDEPEVRTAAAFVDLVRDTPDEAVRRLIIAEDLHHPETRPLAEQAIAGDEAAIEELVGRASEYHPGKRDRIEALYRDPATVVDPAREILGAWIEHFQPIEARVTAMLERDVELRAEDRRSLEPAELIERTTGGIRWLSEPGVRRVVLAPSYFARPYNFLLSGDDWRMFGYPIADAALDLADPLAPPQSLVRLHRALGDETRLRILRLVAERDWYLTEIAERLELSKPTIKHHLAQLRVAGLVTLTEEGGLTYYSLRRQRAEEAGRDLLGFLEH